MENHVRAILFDLDGTLLGNDMDLFLPPYFKILSARVAHAMPADEFIPHLMRATEVMMANDGRDTNEEVFSSVFYPLAGLPREHWEPIFVDFYVHDFPALQQFTQRKPEARQVVQRAFDLGLDVVVATNPLFPALAIQHRIEWADVAGFAYDLVTSYENSRAIKPNLLYFEQILETLGQRPEDCLVVGDEDMDMVAAHLGCQTFLVPGSRTNLSPTTPKPTYEGSLADVGVLLQSWG